MKALIGFMLIGILWIVSIPCTLLVIVFQLAQDNADKIYVWIDGGLKDIEPSNKHEKRMSFKEKLEERMKQNPPPERKKTVL